ncbi:hypothetical protein LIER_37732 [Lithospermum erythrorhizon]|uniref:PGR5-like protein 1A, chloroplastic n=1 Tax=Lithospermum erythrorhizon TaxID=34254 RepID=A0AAV3PPX3_LITER
MATKYGFTIISPRLANAPLRKPSNFAPLSTSCKRVQGFFNFNPLELSHKRRVLVLTTKASTDQPGQVKGDDVVDSNVLQYCSLDKKEKKSIGEMEQDFLQALQSFYYEGKAIMSNEEFDNLKEELMWEGSSVVMLSGDEQRFLEASMAYVAGNPILTDEEFDKLKMKLKVCGFSILHSYPTHVDTHLEDNASDDLVTATKTLHMKCNSFHMLM